MVTRTAYKSNKSEYSVNGRTSSYKDVQMLLKGKDIDLDHNRFLILQVSSILSIFLWGVHQFLYREKSKPSLL